MAASKDLALSESKDFSQAQRDQIFVLTGIPWVQFEAIEAAFRDTPGIRLRFCEEIVEIVSVSEQHEMIKAMIRLLLEVFLLEQGIEFVCVGNATRMDKNKGVQFEPDESYYLGGQKEHPDLAIEVVLSSGGITKLRRYQVIGIPEVWFWQEGRLVIYHLGSLGYELVERSVLLPALDPELLVECIGIPSRLDAVARLRQGMA